MQFINITLIAILLGILATLLLNLGKGVSKFGLKQMGLKKEPRRKYKWIWIGGILVTTTSVFVNIFALNWGNASIIASLSGVGITALLIFSYYVLDELLDRIVYIGIVLTLVGTVIVALSTTEMHQEALNFINFWIFFLVMLVPIILGIVYCFKNEHKFFGFIFGILAGFLSGFAVVLEKIGLVIMGGVENLFLQLLTMGGLMFLLAIIMGLSATASTQYGLTRGKASIQVPAFNACYIVIPVVCEYIVFYTVLNLFQIMGICMILGGIVLMTAFKPEPLDVSPLDKD